MSGRYGCGAADDEVGSDDALPAGRRFAFQTCDGPAEGQFREAGDVLADGGEVDMGQAGQAAVVESDDGDLLRDGYAGAEEGVQDAGGAAVVEGEHGGGP